MAIQKQEVYVTTDGSQFTDLVEAEGHQFGLDNAAVIDTAVSSFVNSKGLVGRTRSGNINTAKEFLAWYLAWTEAGSEAIEISEELQVKIDADAAAVAAKSAAAKAKAGDKGESGETKEVEKEAAEGKEASADLFA